MLHKIEASQKLDATTITKNILYKDLTKKTPSSAKDIFEEENI